AAGRLPVARGCALDDGDRLRRAIIERIMCRYAVDLDATAAELGLPAPDFAAELEALGELARDGLVAVDGRRLAVPAEARPLVRCVAAAFDAYLRPEAGRHSAAV
ncbi:MAG TPA: coproporphyrinogen III oxidase, partial [Alphaproteobacteria bacterium]|nr:coproporphyrinogen III oxidase [Alphaproteobacteria bacterium]